MQMVAVSDMPQEVPVPRQHEGLAPHASVVWGHFSASLAASWDRPTLSLLPNTLSLLIFRADPQQPTSSHLFHPQCLLLLKAGTSLQGVADGEAGDQLPPLP